MQPANGEAQPSKVYVGSLHFNVTVEALRSIFSPFGTLIDVQIHVDPATRVSKGFGFVTFATPAEAKRAMNELNGLEILGRPMKVGECTEQNGGLTGDVAQSDDLALGDRLEGDEGMSLNQAQRSLLMARLQRDAAGVEEAKARLPTQEQLQEAAVHVPASKCIVLQNCFSTAEEEARPDNAGWEAEIEADVKLECEGHGKVDHIKLEKDSGCIYVKFNDITGAMAAKEALHGRFFGGQTVSVDYITPTVYQKKYGV
jgi:RNA-binding protein 39